MMCVQGAANSLHGPGCWASTRSVANTAIRRLGRDSSPREIGRWQRKLLALPNIVYHQTSPTTTIQHEPVVLGLMPLEFYS